VETRGTAARSRRANGLIELSTSGLIRLLAELWQALSDAFEPSLDIAAKVNANDAALSVIEREEIAEGLGALERGEPIDLTRDGDVLGCISREHDEHARVRSTLMQLAGGMQVTRPVPERSGHLKALADSTAERLQYPVSRRCALKIG
jgi:hypothetical protein